MNIIDLNNKIVKMNKLISARHDFTKLTEYRLIEMALSKIHKGAKKIEPVVFKVDEFCRIMEIEKRGNKGNIKRTCENLRKCGVSFIDEFGDWQTHAWIPSATWKDDFIILPINRELERYLLFSEEQKEKGFTRYPLKIILKLSTFYSMRLYELLVQYRLIGNRKFSIEELKPLLGVYKTHRQYKDFKKRVILPALKEINALSDIFVDFSEQKKSCKVVGLQFHLKTNPNFQNNYITNYHEMPKIKLIELLKKYFYQKTGIDISAFLFNRYHHVILVELATMVETGTFNNTLIQSPEGFVKWHLENINSMYNRDFLKTIEEF